MAQNFNNGDLVNINSIALGATSADASSKTDVVSTTQGARPIPTMTAVQASGIVGPADGLMIRVSDAGGKIFVYDSGNSQFESIETTTIAFGRNGSSDGVYLRYGGDATNTGTGYISPYDGVIKEVTAIETGGNPTKALELEVNGVLAQTFTLAGSTFTDTNDGTTFSSGDRLNMFVSATGAAATNVAITLNIKWVI